MSSDAGVEAIVVLTTVGTAEEGLHIAEALVHEQLAACVGLLPEMTSVYRWNGAVHRDSERQMIIKTTRRALDAVRDRLHQLHSYEVPEFLVLPVTSGSEPYLRWIGENTAGRG